MEFVFMLHVAFSHHRFGQTFCLSSECHVPNIYKVIGSHVVHICI